MTAQVDYVRLAQTLPPRLLKFFARYPPLVTSATSQRGAATAVATSVPTSSADPTADHPESMLQTTLAPSDNPNPFKPHKHPETGRWHDPVYSLRRQADLVKMAKANGIEDLLPYTMKGSLVGRRRREEQGLRVKGTGVGQRVKGKAWERTMKTRLGQRKEAMLGMPAMVQQWKQPSCSTLLIRCDHELLKPAELQLLAPINNVASVSTRTLYDLMDAGRDWNVLLELVADAEMKDDLLAAGVELSHGREVLPSNVKPIHYRLTLEPNFEKFTYEGEVVIDLDVKEDTTSISLNTLELDIHSTRISVGGNEISSSPNLTYNEDAQTTTITFDKSISAGSKAQLTQTFTGQLNDKMAGFYRSSYKHNGTTKYLATTQMEPTDARRAFPISPV
ncbi:MAG: hypothetical protein Q9224_004361, partial [Gallowayella concinna]